MAQIPLHLVLPKKEMIEQLKAKGISDAKVLNAFEKVNRHEFVESHLWRKAYEELALQLPTRQTISRPYTVAFQSQLLEIKGGEKVLEIGTGSGFQAAILSAMGARVYSIERYLELYQKTKKLLDDIDYRIITHYGDGFLGWPKYAPFDKIIVTCGAPNVPDSLLNQLNVGGCMVIPVGEDSQIMKRLTKISDTEIKTEEFGEFSFVPMLQNTTKLTE